MGHYADAKTRLTTFKEGHQRSSQLFDTSASSMNIKFRDGDGNPDDTLLYDYTGTGGIKGGLTAWRAANGSVSSGTMYDMWNRGINTMSDSDYAAEKAKHDQTVADTEADIAWVQKIIDNGEDPTNIS